jgi:lipopolysaccharide transport system ATP-binding protein
MAKAVIKVENLSKQYRLGNVGTGSLLHDLNRIWYTVRGKDDPYLQVGQENDRSAKSSSEYVWALKDINFEIEKGSVTGIIGKNGAGKSTLLKILSKTTSPTTGSVKIKGRMASLLEVGTGFHPELTGRENVYLNGAILGMHKWEITRKFDEIVAFSGVERYIDTPVKRYSSGMYVRLAFAVAAHLEPDILVIDEVLAVGDVDFQKKCLGKMRDVSKEDGRTILFVSHNMTAIKNICSDTMFLKNGLLIAAGNTERIIKQYLSHESSANSRIAFQDASAAPGNEFIRVKRIEVVPAIEKDQPITVHTPLDIEIEFWNYVENEEINVSLHLNTMNYECVFNVGTKSVYLKAGLQNAVCHIPGDFLNDGFYTIMLMFVAGRSKPLFQIADAVNIEVHEEREETGWHGKWPGFVRPNLDFEFINS